MNTTFKVELLKDGNPSPYMFCRTNVEGVANYTLKTILGIPEFDGKPFSVQMERHEKAGRSVEKVLMYASRFDLPEGMGRIMPYHTFVSEEREL